MTGSIVNSEFCFPSTLNIEALISGNRSHCFPWSQSLIALSTPSPRGQCYHAGCVDAFVEHGMRVNLGLSTEKNIWNASI